MAAKTAVSDVRIVVLQRGWVMVGKFSRKGSQCFLDQASVLRRWGTSKGLGEIAAAGPVEGKTVLDPANGQVEFNELTVIATLKCAEEKWTTHLK